VKTRVAQPVKKEASDSKRFFIQIIDILESENSDSGSSQNQLTSTVDSNEEYENKKKKNYEEARDRILQETGENEKEIKPSSNTNTKQKKGKRFEKGYDPDFDRSVAQPEMSVFVGSTNLGTMNPMGHMNPPPGMGYYPMYNQPHYTPYQGFAGSNSSVYPPHDFGTIGSYGYPYPTQNMQTKSTTSYMHYQNFPTLDRSVNYKK